MPLIFCVMIMLYVLFTHEFCQDYLNHFLFNVHLLFLMSQCGHNLHTLPCLVHEMLLVNDIDMGPFGLCS